MKTIFSASIIVLAIVLTFSCKKEDKHLPSAPGEIFVNRDNFNVCLPDTLEFSINPVENAEDGEYKWVVETAGTIIGASNTTSAKVAIPDSYKFGDSLIVKVRGANQHGYGAYSTQIVVAQGIGENFTLAKLIDNNHGAVYFAPDLNPNMPSSVTSVEWMINNNSTQYEIGVSAVGQNKGFVNFQLNGNNNQAPITDVHAIVTSAATTCKSKFSIKIP